MNHLFEMLQVLTRNHVRFIIGGGVALVLQGGERMTMDLDIALDFQADNVDRFLKSTQELRLVPRAPVAAKVLAHPAERERMIQEKGALVFTFLDPENAYRVLDVFLTADLSFSALESGSETIEIGGLPIKCLTRQKLLEIKTSIQPARDKDAYDIKVLRKLLENE